MKLLFDQRQKSTKKNRIYSVQPNPDQLQINFSFSAPDSRAIFCILTCYITTHSKLVGVLNKRGGGGCGQNRSQKFLAALKKLA